MIDIDEKIKVYIDDDAVEYTDEDIDSIVETLSEDEKLELLGEELDYLQERTNRLWHHYHGSHDQKKHGKRGAGTGARKKKGGFRRALGRSAIDAVGGAAVGAVVGGPLGALGGAIGGVGGGLAGRAIRRRLDARKLRRKSRPKSRRRSAPSLLATLKTGNRAIARKFK